MVDVPRLEEISTRWPLLGDPLHIVMRYAPAIRAYLGALVQDDDDADEVCQDFLARVLRSGFVHATPERGRFRMYLKASVRNAAWMFFRARARQRAGVERLEGAYGDDAPAVGDAWTTAWRACVVERATAAVMERGGAAERVLQLIVQHDGLDSTALAALVSAQTGEVVRADALRKQLSRARRAVAAAIVAEVVATLETPTASEVETELRETGLWAQVEGYLEEGWRARVGRPG